MLLYLASQPHHVGVVGAPDSHKPLRGDPRSQRQRQVDLTPQVRREPVEPELQSRAVGFEDGAAVRFEVV